MNYLIWNSEHIKVYPTTWLHDQFLWTSLVKTTSGLCFSATGCCRGFLCTSHQYIWACSQVQCCRLHLNTTQLCFIFSFWLILFSNVLIQYVWQYVYDMQYVRKCFLWAELEKIMEHFLLFRWIWKVPSYYLVTLNTLHISAVMHHTNLLITDLILWTQKPATTKTNCLNVFLE